MGSLSISMALHGKATVSSGDRNEKDYHTIKNCKWLTAWLQTCTCLSSSPRSEHQAEGEPGFIHVQCHVLFMAFCACNTALFPAFFVTSLVSQRSAYMVFRSPGSPYIFSNHWLIPCILGTPLTYISPKIKCYFKLPAVPDRMAFHSSMNLHPEFCFSLLFCFLRLQSPYSLNISSSMSPSLSSQHETEQNSFVRLLITIFVSKNPRAAWRVLLSPVITHASSICCNMSLLQDWWGIMFATAG